MNNEQITAREAQNLANEVLTYMDLGELFQILEIDEGEFLTQLILDEKIDVSSLYAFLE